MITVRAVGTSVSGMARVSGNRDQGMPVRFYRYRQSAPPWAYAVLRESGAIDSTTTIQRREVMKNTDAWGRPLMTETDGHSAWACNNYDCAIHPQSLYGGAK